MKSLIIQFRAGYFVILKAVYFYETALRSELLKYLSFSQFLINTRPKTKVYLEE